VYTIVDTNFFILSSVAAPSEYMTDGHEIRFTSEGDRIIIANDREMIDMSKYVTGGNSHANVVVPLILEFDKGNNLIFQWRAIDHYKVTDAAYEDLTLLFIDFCHINSIEFDMDSNLIISCRNMDEITKIDRETGNIIWRWGGKTSQFSIVGDSIPFSHQHSVRRTPEGTYTMFDNGNLRSTLQTFSRAVEYRLDTVNHLATKIWEFRHNPDIETPSMGYVQRLPGKRTLIGWGNYLNIAVTEVDSENNTRFEMAMPDKNFSYRAYKYDANYVHGRVNSAVAQIAPALDVTLDCIPNPITAQAQIQCWVPEFSNIHISLFDQLAREVSKIYAGDLSPGKHSFIITSGELPAGMYYLRAIGGNGLSLEKKVIILK
jgi:hypothetical protein